MFRLVLATPAGSPMSVELSATPVYLGRASTNDLILTDKAVSSRHAAVFTSGIRVFVEDLGSRNGTFVGAARVRKIAEIPPDEELILAGSVHLKIERPSGVEARRPLLVLEDSDGGVRIPLRTELLKISAEPEADLRIPELLRPVELRVGQDRVWVADVEVRVGGVVLLGARAYRLGYAAPVLSLTAEPDPDGPHYDLRVELTGSPGPRAVLTDPATGAQLELIAPNRVVLLYVLGRRLVAEQALEPSARGWCTDAEVAAALWGRSGADRNLNVLVTRVRNDLRRAGLDPWVLEKRQGHVRARLGAVELVG